MSGVNLPWWKRIIYHCISLDENKMKYLKESDMSKGVGNKGFEAIMKMKKKHFLARQLLNEFMKNPYDSYIGYEVADEEIKAQIFEDSARKEITSSMKKPEENKGKQTTCVAEAKTETKIETKSTEKVDINGTAILVAAKNGIVEIVSAIQHNIQSAIHDTTSNKENILLVAVKNRHPIIVEELKMKFDKKLFQSLIYETDDKDNNVLHLAAGIVDNNRKTWKMITGAFMQMMWDIKWYQYIKAQVPEHFAFRTNKDGQTPGEIFEEQHIELLKESFNSLRETLASCSAVAVLIVGVSFASLSTVPGGIENGKPTLEDQPALYAFDLASLMTLSFSVTALIIFLVKLISRKEAKDFIRSLPMKILFGLSSLSLSIFSMFITFFSSHFFVVSDKYKNFVFTIYVATCLPLTLFLLVQFPFYAELVKVIFKKMPPPSRRGIRL